MSYYGIFTDKSGLNGVPVFFETRIYEQETKDPFNVKNGIYYDWMKPGFNEYPFADPLYLYTKNKKIAFDYYYNQSMFVLSQAFLDVADAFNKSYRSSQLSILSNKEEKEFSVTKEYRFVKYDYTDAAHVIDFEKSRFDPSLDDSGNPLIYNGVRYVSKYHSLEFKNNINQDLFLLKDTLLCQYLFCSQQFKEAALKANLYGLIFVPIAEVPDFIARGGFPGKAS